MKTHPYPPSPRPRPVSWLLWLSMLLAFAPLAAFGAPSLSLEMDSLPLPGTKVHVWGSGGSIEQHVQDAVAIAAGDVHQLALKSDGTVVAYGNNSHGETEVPAGLTDVIAIAAGASHSVALKADGSVVAWGSNNQGETTVPLEAQSNVKAIAAGEGFTAALKTNGTLITWGADLGMNGLSGIQAIAACGWQFVVLEENGDVYSNWDYVPHEFEEAQPVAIAAGGNHFLILLNNGKVTAHGQNHQGQTSVPEGLGGVIGIAAGVAHSVALKSDGSIVNWGGTFFGQLNTPAGLPKATSVAAGGHNTMALTGQRVEIPATVTKTITLKNTGGHPLNIGSVVIEGGQAGDFTLDTSSLLQTVPVGSQTSVGVTFNPGARGSRQSSLKITSDDPARSRVQVALVGVKAEMVLEQPAGSELQDGEAVTFSTTQAGAESFREFTLRNTGNEPLEFDVWAAGNGNWDSGDWEQFEVTNYPASPLAPGGSVTFQVKFAPNAGGQREGYLIVSSNDWQDNHVEIPLVGFATAPKLVVERLDENSNFLGEITNGGALQFPPTALGGENSVRLLLYNAGDADLVIENGEVSDWSLVDFEVGTGGWDFSFNSGTPYSVVIPPNDSRDIRLWFHPEAAGMRKSFLSFETNEPVTEEFRYHPLYETGDPYLFEITLTGTGTQPVLVLQQPAGTNLGAGSTVTFPSAAVGESSALQFTLLNTGDGLAMPSIWFMGGNENDFTVSNEPYEIEPSESATFTVTFTPGGTGARGTEMMVYYETENGHYVGEIVINLSGLGTAPMLPPTVATPTAASIAMNSATLGGNVTSDGGATITERGVVYSLTVNNANPSIDGATVTKVVAAGTTGVFTVPVSGLSAHTGYSFKAYAINGAGTSYSDTGSFSTLNTLPTAPNGNATGTTGDPNTVTISFPTTDADGDAVAIIAAASGNGITVDSFTATTVTFTPGSSFTGDGSFTYTVSDGFGGSATGTITVAVTDNDAPLVGAPTEGFTSLALTVNAGTGVVDLPDYRGQVVASDNVGVVSLTQSPAPGSAIGQGVVQVSITATDAAGNVSDALELTVVVSPAATSVAGWSFTAWTGDSTTGIHASTNVWAYRFGSATTATVNGVTVPGSPFSLTSANVDVTLTSSYQGASNNLTALGGTGSALLAQDFVYNGVKGPLTATVKNLTVGQTYIVSFFGVGFDAGVARSVNFTSGADSQVVNQNHYGLGNGIRVDYHFTATAATRSFTLMETVPLYSWGLNAITLRKVSIPDLVTDAATDVTTESATLNATVNPDGLAATAHFEYGLTTAYGSTAAITLSPADGSSAQAVSAPVSGLTAGRTYYYRVALTNLHGTFYGEDQTFSTVQIPSLFALSATTISVPQGSASVTIPLHRTGGSHAAGVQLSTVDGTASAVPPFAAGLAGKDYTSLTTTVDFAEGEMLKEVEITLIPRKGTNVPNTRFGVVLTGAGWDDIPADPKLGHPITATLQVLANDTTAPTLSVKTPASGATINVAPPVVITGTTGDKNGIDRVEIEHNGELIVADLGAATKATSVPFTAEIFPATDGPVTFTVTTYDLQGNSTVLTRSFNYLRWYDLVVSRSVPSGLATPEAGGTVTLASTKGSFSALTPAKGDPTQLGRVLPGAPVTLTAKPGVGHVFSHWDGLPPDALTAGPVASFTMPAEDVTEILAVFVANPFAALGTSAVFHGLLAPHETQRGNATLGSLSATLTTKTGALSGKLLMNGVSTSFTGVIQGNGDVVLKSSSGQMTGALEIPSLGTLVLSFAANSLAINLQGAVTDSYGTAHVAIHSAANPVPAVLLSDAKQGFYTVALPALEQTPPRPASTYPQGAGYGTLTLKTNGTLTLAGVLADGSKFTASSALVTGNTSPVHAQLPTPGSTTLKGGSLLGVLAFDPDAPDTDVSSASLGWAVFGGKGGPPPESGSGLLWLRPEVVQQTGTTAAALATQLYTEGWEQGLTVGLVGALYDKTRTVQSALELLAAGPAGNAELAFEGGKLLDTVAYTSLNVDGSKVVKLPTTDKRYTLTLTSSTGAMKGTFTPFWSNPGTALPAFNGVILQKGTNKGGWGFFLSNRVNDLDPESGSVTLGKP